MPNPAARLHPILKKDEAGEVHICWRRTVGFSGLVVACFLVPQFLLHHYRGLDIYPSKLATIAALCVCPILLQSYVALRFAQGKPLTQISVRWIIVAISYVCILLAFFMAARKVEARKHPRDEVLESQIMQILQDGHVEVDRRNVEIELHRRDFADADFQALRQLFLPLSQRKYFIALDLSGTSVGDDTLAELGSQPRLNVLRLRGTNVSDASKQLLISYKKLRELDIRDASISPSCVAALRSALPQTTIHSD